MTHVLKTWPQYFNAIIDGRKTFECRKNDRPFAVGDVLHLLEWDPETQEYTGRSMDRRITYILDGKCTPPGLCVMSIVAEHVPPPTEATEEEIDRVVKAMIAADRYTSERFPVRDMARAAIRALREGK